MVILDLVERVAPLAEGMSARVRLRNDADVALARTWCELTGNTLVATSNGWGEIRRGRPVRAVLALPLQRRPGVRLWMYTNFNCNLACTYCCVRSSPAAARRPLGTDRIARLAEEAAAWGVAELWLTGGEPFLLADIADSIRACVARRPTTVLTNGMLFTGRRLETLRSLPRTGLTLQISLDAPSPERHDRVRGRGSWARAMNGIRTARALGFHVRVTATVHPVDAHAGAEAERFSTVLDELAIDRADLLVRPVARRGFSASGIELAPETLVPDVTVTVDGVYWHPVGAADADMLVDGDIFPLGDRIDRVIELFEERAQRLTSAALSFPCA